MSAEQSIPVTVNGNIAIVTAPGYVNEKSAEVISQECNRLIEDGVRHVLIDMGECRMVNSVGIAIIIEIIEVIGERDGTLGFCCLSETIAKTFQIMGLLQLTAIFESEEDALQAMPG